MRSCLSKAAWMCTAGKRSQRVLAWEKQGLDPQSRRLLPGCFPASDAGQQTVQVTRAQGYKGQEKVWVCVLKKSMFVEGVDADAGGSAIAAQQAWSPWV